MSAPHQEHRDRLRRGRNALSAVSFPQATVPRAPLASLRRGFSLDMPSAITGNPAGPPLRSPQRL